MDTRAPIASLLLLLSCVPESQPQARVVRSPGREIVGGTVDFGDPAVVAIALPIEPPPDGPPPGWPPDQPWDPPPPDPNPPPPFHEWCSGTVIAPRVILTAAHCIIFTPDVTKLIVFFGTDLDSTVRRHVIGGVADPEFDRFLLNGHDVGVMFLDEDAPVPPVPISRQDAASLVGQPDRVIGFGIDDAFTLGGLGIKRQVSLTIDFAGDGVIESYVHGHSACFGDSGGPVLVAEDGGEAIVAVNSYADLACAEVAGSSQVALSMESFLRPILDAVSAGRIPYQCALACPTLPFADCVDGGARVAFSVQPGPGCPAVETHCSAESGDFFPLGINLVACTAKDEDGFFAGACGFYVPVFDARPPVITVKKDVLLWPPDHALHTVRASDLYEAVDACRGPIDVDQTADFIDVYSSEAEESRDATCNDLVVLDAHQVQLRAERDAAGPGRTYHVDAFIGDGAGHSDYAHAHVLVPHDQGQPLEITESCAFCADGPRWPGICLEGEPCPVHDPACR